MTESTTTAAAQGRGLDRFGVAKAPGSHLSKPRRRRPRSRGRQAAWLLAAVVVLVVLTAASVALGARGLSLATVWQAFTQFDPANGDHAVVHARIPRTVLGLLVGGALGLAGAVMQGVTRNPLADPGILGVTSAPRWPWSPGSPSWRHLTSAYILVASLARSGRLRLRASARWAAAERRRSSSRSPGAALDAALSSLIERHPAPAGHVMNEFRFWQIGGVAGRDWEWSCRVSPFLVVGAADLPLRRPNLNSLALGDEVAAGLGERVGHTRRLTAPGSVLLCGAVTAVAGPIGSSDWSSHMLPAADRDRPPLAAAVLPRPGRPAAGRGRDRPRGRRSGRSWRPASSRHWSARRSSSS